MVPPPDVKGEGASVIVARGSVLVSLLYKTN